MASDEIHLYKYVVLATNPLLSLIVRVVVRIVGSSPSAAVEATMIGRQSGESKDLILGSVRLIHGRTSGFFDYDIHFHHERTSFGQRNGSDRELTRLYSNEPVITTSMASLTFFIVVKYLLVSLVDYPSKTINIRPSVRVMRMKFSTEAGSDKRVVMLEDSPTAKSTIIEKLAFFLLKSYAGKCSICLK